MPDPASKGKLPEFASWPRKEARCPQLVHYVKFRFNGGELAIWCEECVLRCKKLKGRPCGQSAFLSLLMPVMNACQTRPATSPLQLNQNHGQCHWKIFPCPDSSSDLYCNTLDQSKVKSSSSVISIFRPANMSSSWFVMPPLGPFCCASPTFNPNSANI